MSATHVFRLTNIAGSAKDVQKRLRSIVCSLAFMAFGVLAASDAQAASSPEVFVQSNIDRSYAILNDAALSPSERQVQFRALLPSIVDVRRVGLFTLGPYARAAAQADVDKFEFAFTNLLAEVYLRGLSTYSALKVTGSTERSRDDAIVNVAAHDASGKSAQLHLAFRVRQTSSGEHAVTDLQIEGAWLALTQRAEFTAYLQRNGGGLEALSAEIEEKAVRLRVKRIENEIQRKGSGAQGG